MLIQGPVTVGDQSDIDGNVIFDALPAGQYTLTVRRRGYRVVKRSFTVDPEESVKIDVALASISEPKEIASVVVHNSVDGNSSIDFTNPIRVLSPSLNSALDDLPGLSLVQGNEPGATQTLSILGHDPSATAVSLDGIPLNVPGTAFNFSTLDSDVLDHLLIAYGPSGSGEGGSVTLRTLDPTSTWQTGLDADTASFGRSFLSLSEQGTDGRLAVAYKQAFRSNGSSLSGDTYEDSSGLDYFHAGDLITRGDALKISYHTSSSNSLSVTSIDSSSYADALCTLYTNPLPCGYGPGNYSTGAFRLSAISDAFSAGSTSWIASEYVYAADTNVNLWNQLIAGERVPFASSYGQATAGLSLSGDVPLGERDDITVQTSINSLALNSSANTPSNVESGTQTLHYSNVLIKDRHHVSRNLQASLTAQQTSVSGTKGAISGQAEATFDNSATQTTSLGIFVGRGINPDGSETLLTPPGLLQYNCTARTATGLAPGDPIDTNSLNALSATWNDQLPQAELTIQAYDQGERHGSLTALVNGTAFPPTLFFPGYFAAAQQLYQLSTNCGRTSQLDPSNFYFATTVSDVTLLYQGIRVEAEIPVERAIDLRGSLSLNRVAAWSSDPRLENPLTIFRPGQQIQGVPFATAYLSASYKPLIPTIPQIYVGARYTGYDGPSFLPPNVTADAALVQHLQYGELSLLVNNLFNAYAGRFVTPLYAVPLITTSGAAVPGTATPNEPRTITVSYTVGIGPNADVESSAGRGFGEESGADESLAPGYLLEKWPLTRPSDPFRRNNGSACTRERARDADNVVTPLEQLIARIDSSKTAAGYPQTLPSSFAVPSGVSYLHTPGGYALRLFTTKLSTINAFLSCQLIHIGTQGNAQAAGLPYPPTSSLTSASFYYTPSVGFYFIQVPQAKGLAQNFRTYQLPTTPPLAPFALVAGSTCLPDLQPIAQRLLSELKSFFAEEAPMSGSTEDWQITRHRSEKGLWYELKSDDLGSVTSLINCGRIDSAGRKQLEDLGWGGGGANEFNFTRSLGLYIVSGS